ncbi:SMI1/KNR4 family protein [Hymenobacter sp.]|uniref:SMI1/KNR4 family protein n=1 Tax=Hymenobacter sp. TaxID=1898978 RepID=UPI00286D4C56|nr:SMI1/KNR4 family protein [Hymenobacter sp.]
MHTFEHLKKQPVIAAADAEYLQAHRLADGGGFPPSYIDFATQLGWGRLCDLLLIYVPLGPYPDSWLVQSPKIRQFMNEFYQEMEHDPFLLEPDGYESIDRSLVPFGASENGEYLAWDTAHRASDGEFPIYILASRMGGIRYGAENLHQFVEKCTNDAAVKTMFGPGCSALPAIFEPLALAN